MARWPWSDRTDPAGVMRPLVTSTLLGSFSSSRRLGLMDVRVAAFVVERWREQGTLSSDEPARLNLYELGWALYGRKPGKAENDQLRESIQRLFEVEIDAKGIDVRSGRTRLVARKGRIFAQVDCELDELEDAGPAQFGALRGATYEIHLGPWLADQIKAGGRLDLDLAVMRRLRKLAERLWLYLEAEAFVDAGAGVEQLAAPIPVVEEFLNALSVRCARPVDARKAINQAAQKIRHVDPRYEQLGTQQTRDGHVLWAVRRPSVSARAAAPVLVEEVATAT